MFGSCCILLPPFLGRAGQRLSAFPRDGSLLLRHVGFPCPHVLGCLSSAGCVGFPLLGCLRCFEQVGSVGFLLPSFPRSFDVLRLSPVVRLHSCSPSSCTAAFLSRCRRVSHLPTPGHLYLDLTARSWSRTLRGWQARLPWSGLVISQIPKRLSPTFVAPLLCSSRRNVVNADLCFLLALQQACSEGLVDSHYLSCGCSVVPLHTGSPYSGCGLAWPIGAQVRPVFSYKMGLIQHCCTLLGLVQHARVDSGSLPLTSSCTDSLKSLTPAECELEAHRQISAAG
jgi:hypothetical protein